MAQANRTVHSKNIEGNCWRDLQVYYSKAEPDFWNGGMRPCGIYFASHLYTKSEGMRSWTSGQKGDGYLLVIPLERYSRKQLGLVRERVEADPDRVHDLLDRGAVAQLKAMLAGEGDPVAAGEGAEASRAA